MMDKITEIIPDDIPEWARKAISDGQLWNRVFARINDLESLNERQAKRIVELIGQKAKLESILKLKHYE